MKILFLSKSHNPIGGVERWLTDLAVGLGSRGHECMVGLAHGQQFHDADAYLAAQQVLETLQVFKIECRTGSYIERRSELIGLIRRTRPDIVVPVMLHDGLCAVSICKARGQRLKLVYPIHESEVWAYEAVAEYEECIDAVVSVNKLMEEALSEFLRWPEKRNYHVQCGIDPPKDSEQLRRCSSEVIEIGFCGRLSETQKRASDLMKFCLAMDQRGLRYRLSIAGGGSSEELLRGSLQDHIARGQVQLLGWLSQDDLYRKFYPNLHVLLITSEWETGPLVAWEAMMHGVLVLASEYRGLRMENVLRDRETALVYPVGKMDEAVAKLNEVSADPVLFQRIAKNGKEFARRHLGVEEMIDKWASCFDTVLSLPHKMPNASERYHLQTRPMDWIEYYARRFMNRPIRHSNSHSEWPRYKPGHVTWEERVRFVQVLDKLEKELVQGNQREGMAGSATGEHIV